MGEWMDGWKEKKKKGREGEKKRGRDGGKDRGREKGRREEFNSTKS